MMADKKKMSTFSRPALSVTEIFKNSNTHNMPQIPPLMIQKAGIGFANLYREGQV